MAPLKQALKSKTVWFSITLAVLSVVQGYLHVLPLTPQGQMYAGLGIAVVVTLLRVVTTQPLTEK